MGPVEAFIALGSNLGDSRRILESAFARLQTLSASPIRTSSLWRSAPVDCPPGSPDFINAVAAIMPLAAETPETLLHQLQSIETELGRRPRMVLNEPRVLDLDLIAFGRELRCSPQLTLPHPRATRRAFVLLPLIELAPGLVLPGQTQSVEELDRKLADSSAVMRLGR